MRQLSVMFAINTPLRGHRKHENAYFSAANCQQKQEAKLSLG